MEEHAHHHPGMLSVEEAQERLLSAFAPLEGEERPLLEALGQTLAEEVTASFPIPPWANSAMDGYALRWEDIRGASPETPRTLTVIGYIPAGSWPEGEVRPGTAYRIMTGAPVPPGADTVVPFEETDELQRKSSGRGLDEISVLREVKKGANVRHAGEDISPGQTVLRRGTVLGPAEVGVLASLGRERVRVVRRPRVAVLSTGDELVPPGGPLAPGKIYDANTYSIASAVREAGGVPLVLGIARDRWEDLTEKIEEGLGADLFLSSAGVSKGDYDIVKEALASRGEVSFWTVRMKPGKPMAFGFLRAPDGRRVPHIGLPGNPVSALVVFELFCRPAIRKMLGQAPWRRSAIEAVLEGSPIRNTDGRRVYARVVVERRGEGYVARPVGPQASHILTGMARANALAICPEDLPEVRPGQRVQVLLLEKPEEMSAL